MKTTLLNNLSIVAVMASLLLIPVNTSAAALALTFTGVIALLQADYGRKIEPVMVRGEVLSFSHAGSERVAVRQAA
jgi:hypothetical protein